MRRSLVAGVALVAALTACGPTDHPAASGRTDPTTPATATTAAATATAAAPAGGVTPDRLCGMLTVAQAASITGFPIDAAEPSTSDDVAVCTYRAGEFAKLIVEYQPHGKTLFEFTKARGEAVTGVGLDAVYFDTSGELQVLLDGDATLHCFAFDVRIHHGDPKGGTVAAARVVVPRLTGA